MKKRIVSGNRPTGKLHIGHYHGALQNWIELQDKYDCFFFVADWHALTTKYDETENLRKDTEDMVIDWLAAGLNPSKCTIYRQSDLPEVAELSLYFSMITPISWLERCPTYKEMLKEIDYKDISTHGFLGYPILQTADIVLYHGELVPVGEDQLPHLELGREIVRRFNYFYGQYFPEPQAVLSHTKRVIGTDGRKMSKSYGNSINLSDSPKEILKKVQTMITDPVRIKRTDPGHPEVCLVHGLHKIYSADHIDEIVKECKSGKIGCVECKKLLAERINESLVDFRAKRAELEKDPGQVWKILEFGAKKVRPIAQETLREIRKRINIDG
ncbi:tryptophan--tRNA ligase [Candidatus Oleimmundimicrobium sp.]|uniref:tryptophan--tRNA ligase n=1 Tax=Candidatus Oleimmundimicrobium sp. TaxID=3060597 RepID=UPI0027194F36|nr:tryptophan--tRNA ligase [Candidatus Oleimmundimicrobium sp.]MDO8886867.1 tryptophan--tRNA ligase [Candidatus Oleimmundimicrobium sp.]